MSQYIMQRPMGASEYSEWAAEYAKESGAAKPVVKPPAAQPSILSQIITGVTEVGKAAVTPGKSNTVNAGMGIPWVPIMIGGGLLVVFLAMRGRGGGGKKARR